MNSPYGGVFVAGGTGLAGSAIVQELLHRGTYGSVRASFCHTQPFLRDSRIEYVKADLSSLDHCRRLVKGCECGIMAAAHTGGAAELTSRPWLQVNENLAMNAALLQAVAEEGVRRVVMVGSATLYQPLDGFIREEDLDLNKDPPAAYHGIGWVTRYVEKLCSFWRSQSNLEICIVRSANIFGPFARFDPRSSNFIPALIRKAVAGLDPFEVWGSPGVTRDVVFSADFARAVVALLERRDLVWDIFNVGSGIRTTVGEAVSWVLKHAGHSPTRTEYKENAPVTAAFRVLDCSKAKRVLGWEPGYTVEQGIGETLRWWKENKDTWTR